MKIQTPIVILLFFGSLMLPIKSEEPPNEKVHEYRFPLTENLILGLDQLTKEFGSLVATLQNFGIIFPDGANAVIDREFKLLVLENTASEARSTLGLIHRFAELDVSAIISYFELSPATLSQLPFGVPENFQHKAGGVGIEGGNAGSFSIKGRSYRIEYLTGDIYDTNEKLALVELESLIYYEETSIRNYEVQFFGRQLRGSENKAVLLLWIPDIMTRFKVYLDSREMIPMAIRDLREITIKR